MAVIQSAVVATPGALYDTFSSGEAISGVTGTVDSATAALNPFGGGTWFGPQYGQDQAYNDGQTVGQITGAALNTVLLASGVSGAVQSVQAIRSAGGLIQVVKVITPEGIEASYYR